LPSFSKIFEKIILQRLVAYFENNNLFYEGQFGFRKNRDTSKAIYEFVTDVAEAIDRSQFTVGVFCDLSKAFDCVNYELLIDKLNFYGVGGEALQLVKSYLSNRKQSVKINSNVQSSYALVTDGVPQGSILGPFLFLVYANDLPYIVNHLKVISYADDTSCIVKQQTPCDLVKNVSCDINLMNSWFKFNGLLLNNSKTFAINFHSNYSNTKQSDDSYLQNIITTSQNSKFLGLHIDCSLKWNLHTSHLTRTLSKGHYLIRVLSRTVDLNTLKMVYYAYIYSHLTYGVIFWGCSQTSEVVFKTQKSIIRTMLHKNQATPSKPLFIQLNILPLPCIYILHTLLFIKNNIHKFNVLNSYHHYPTRNNLLLYPPHKTSAFEKNPSYQGVRLFNKLPPQIRNISCSKQFKTKLMEFLFENMFYSINEFLGIN